MMLAPRHAVRSARPGDRERVFQPPPTIAAGVLLVAACPIGGISNTYSYLAGASIALSVALTTMSSLLAVALLTLVAARDAGEFVRNLSAAVPLAFVFVVLAFAMGWATGAALRATPADCFTLASEFSTRNVAVATAIAMSFAGRPEYAIFATAYFMTELPMLMGAAAVFKKWEGSDRIELARPAGLALSEARRSRDSE